MSVNFVQSFHPPDVEYMKLLWGMKNNFPFLKIESDYSSDSPDPAPVQCGGGGGGVIRPLTWAQLWLNITLNL